MVLAPYSHKMCADKNAYLGRFVVFYIFVTFGYILGMREGQA